MPILTLPYPPSANAYWRTFRGRILVSSEARKYKEQVGNLCARWNLKPLTGPIAVRIQVYRPAKRGDLDNTLKVLLDSLRGHAFEDDSQVIELHAARHDDKERPRAEVHVWQLEAARPHQSPGRWK